MSAEVYTTNANGSFRRMGVHPSWCSAWSSKPAVRQAKTQTSAWMCALSVGGTGGSETSGGSRADCPVDAVSREHVAASVARRIAP